MATINPLRTEIHCYFTRPGWSAQALTDVFLKSHWSYKFDKVLIVAGSNTDSTLYDIGLARSSAEAINMIADHTRKNLLKAQGKVQVVLPPTRSDDGFPQNPGALHSELLDIYPRNT